MINLQTEKVIIEGYSGDLLNPTETFGKVVQLTFAEWQENTKNLDNASIAKKSMTPSDVNAILDFVDKSNMGNNNGKRDIDDVTGLLTKKLQTIKSLVGIFREQIENARQRVLDAGQPWDDFVTALPSYNNAITAAGGKNFIKKLNENDVEAHKLFDKILQNTFQNLTPEQRNQYEALKKDFVVVKEKFEKTILPKLSSRLDRAVIFEKSLEAALNMAKEKNFVNSPIINDLLNQYYQLAEKN